jgi:hypothetical protein
LAFGSASDVICPAALRVAAIVPLDGSATLVRLPLSSYFSVQMFLLGSVMCAGPPVV